ncbi:MAG TPA: Rid family detoxifying hydrolase [Bryobacteraceae bacterium]|nr:Rid family detoxifying hydrolase [Bryobacteraceae bacterium]
MRACLLAATLISSAVAADLKPIFPANAPKPVGPYTPGIAADGYVYVSGQGAFDSSGKLPVGIEQQTRQCLENVKAILTAAGVSTEHVVWSQVFLKNIKDHGAMNKVYASYFPKNPPARSVVSVTAMPGGTPVEIAVVAVRDLKQKKAIASASPRDPASNAVQAGDRVYVSGVLGIDARSVVPTQPRQQMQALVTQMRSVLSKAGLELRNLAYAHVYVDGAMPMKVLGDLLTEVLPSETALSVVQTTALPHGAHVEISGIASKVANRQGDCTSIGDTLYCAGVGGTIDQALKRVKDNMTISQMTTSRIVTTNVFIDDIAHFEAMNKIYAGSFGSWLPTRVTVQPTPKAEELNLASGTDTPAANPKSPRAQVTVIAVK